MNFLITGGCGFIGSHFLRKMVNKYLDNNYICLDAFTYAADIKRIGSIINNSNFKLIKGNILDKELVEKIILENRIEYIINFAAETSVDKSILEPLVFSETNYLGVQTLAMLALKYDIVLHQISTDEVYGSGDDYLFTEDDKLNPSSPYSSSKAAADLLIIALNKTYNLKYRITRSCNNYGLYQHDEKVIPRFISRIKNNQKLQIYGNGLNVREWLHLDDHINALELIITNGEINCIYNIGSGYFLNNLELTNKILSLAKKDSSNIEFIEDRKGHDKKYGINFTKLKKLGYSITTDFDQELLKIYKFE